MGVRGEGGEGRVYKELSSVRGETSTDPEVPFFTVQDAYAVSQDI